MNNKSSIQTFCVKESKDNKTTSPHQLPLYATSSFEMESVDDAIEIFTGKTKGHVYSRYGNPTIDAVGQKVADMESFGLGIDAFGLLTSSGMSAISTLLMSLLNAGDEIITQGNLYGGTTELFQKIISKQGVKTHFIKFDDEELLKKTLDNNPMCKIIYLETPANPTLSCIDLKAISTLAKSYGIVTIVDNTFCTPYLQQPFKHGIDYIIHSSTKYLNGHGNSIGGVIVGKRNESTHAIWTALKLIGSTTNAWDAWLLNNGLKTLSIRMDKHSENALFLAENLALTDGIGKVNYCGLENNRYYTIAKKQMAQFGGMISFEIDGGKREAVRFIDQLNLCTHAPTLGDVDTLILHPATSSHLNIDQSLRDEYGITDNLVRMSVGIENKTDLLNDIKEALKSI